MRSANYDKARLLRRGGHRDRAASSRRTGEGALVASAGVLVLADLGVVLLRWFRPPRAALFFLFLVSPGVICAIGGFVSVWSA